VVRNRRRAGAAEEDGDEMMLGGRRSFAAIVAALVLTGTAFADMMPAARLQTGPQELPCVCDQADLSHSSSSNPLSNLSAIADLNLKSTLVVPMQEPGEARACAAQSVQGLMEGQGSVGLCLYALIGLGLCRSASGVRKLHLGFAPDWYHSGGAHQIGHIYAIEWDSLSSPPACYVQPDYSSEYLSLQYNEGIIVSLLRGSQFTPSTLVYRGPPNMSERLVPACSHSAVA